jgi:hypothetical protein
MKIWKKIIHILKIYSLFFKRVKATDSAADNDLYNNVTINYSQNITSPKLNDVHNSNIISQTNQDGENNIYKDGYEDGILKAAQMVDTVTVVRVTSSAIEEPTPIPDMGLPEDYPTEIDLDLIVFCLNNVSEETCVDFFRFVHFFFAARLASDPALTDFLIQVGVEPNTDILFTQTSTATTSVSFQL